MTHRIENDDGQQDNSSDTAGDANDPLHARLLKRNDSSELAGATARMMAVYSTGPAAAETHRAKPLAAVAASAIEMAAGRDFSLDPLMAAPTETARTFSARKCGARRKPSFNGIWEYTKLHRRSRSTSGRATLSSAAMAVRCTSADRMRSNSSGATERTTCFRYHRLPAKRL